MTGNLIYIIKSVRDFLISSTLHYIHTIYLLPIFENIFWQLTLICQIILWSSRFNDCWATCIVCTLHGLVDYLDIQCWYPHVPLPISSLSKMKTQLKIWVDTLTLLDMIFSWPTSTKFTQNNLASWWNRAEKNLSLHKIFLFQIYKQ